MHDTEPGPPNPALAPEAGTVGDPGASFNDDDSTGFDSLRDDVAALVEDARTYAEAELAFQKTRAALVAKHSGKAIAALVLALVLLHIALIALAVGAVIALAPLVTIWGAILIVVGAMLAGVAVLVWAALRDGKLLAALFASGDDA
jgi:hypothetical protein